MSDRDSSSPDLAPEVFAHYASGYEGSRLSAGSGPLEFARTCELVRRFLPEPPAVVYDVGGGTGVYACWLASEGYEVHLVDAVPLHVQLAAEASQRQPARPLASTTVGDARDLERDAESVDVVLLLGPLYHLLRYADRLAALREARRVLKAGGVICAAGISRYASALDGLARRLIDDPSFVRIVDRDLADGQHRNPMDNPRYFTTAYFHRPDELAAELEAAGIHHRGTFAIEGPAWLLHDLEARWRDEEHRARMLDVIRAIESEPSLLGASAHLLAIGVKGV